MAKVKSQFFDKRAEWSRWKHIILDKYLRVWVYKLSSIHKELAFVDAFAGAGTYSDGTVGSPVIAARWNDAFLVEKGRRLLVIACEQESAEADSLRQALTPWLDRKPPCAVVHERSFEEVLPEILNATRSMPTFFFIDPFGMESIQADNLLPLLNDSRRKATEVLVRADPILFARFAGWLQDDTGKDKQWKSTSAAFRVLLAKLNVDVSAVDAEYKLRGSPPDRMVLFGNYLEIFYHRFKYVQLIPIRESYYASPKYYLIHGTDNPHGCAKINDAVSTTEDTLFKEHDETKSKGQVSMFEPARPLRATLADADAFVANLIRDSGSVQFVEVCAQLALRFGPDFREKHHRRVVLALIKDGRAVIRTEKLEDGSMIESSNISSAEA